MIDPKEKGPRIILTRKVGTRVQPKMDRLIGRLLKTGLYGQTKAAVVRRLLERGIETALLDTYISIITDSMKRKKK